MMRYIEETIAWLCDTTFHLYSHAVSQLEAHFVNILTPHPQARSKLSHNTLPLSTYCSCNSHSHILQSVLDPTSLGQEERWGPDRVLSSRPRRQGGHLPRRWAAPPV